MGCVYVLENKINNKLYIGQTTRSFEKRFRRYLEEIKNENCRMVITRALKKHGKDNFKKHIFYLPNKLLDYFEVEMIKKLNTIIPNGYNVCSGGNKNRVVHEVTKRKMSKAKKGKKLSKERILEMKKLWKDPEYKKKMSQIHKGQKAWNKGRYTARISKRCLQCGIKFESLKKANRKFCSRKCYGKYYIGNNNVSKRKKVREKISNKLSGIIRTKETKNKISKILKKRWQKKKEEIYG